MTRRAPNGAPIMFNSTNDVILSQFRAVFVNLLDNFGALGAIDQTRNAEEPPVPDHRDHM